MMTYPIKRSIRTVVAALLMALLCGALSPCAVLAQDTTLENKRIVLDFYSMIFEKHQVREAFDKYAGSTYIQHNPSVPDGVEPDVKFLDERFRTYPKATNEVKRVVAEGDLVVLHVHSRLSPDDRGRAIIDIFRVERGKIVEHWDVIQSVPEKAANTNTMF